MGRMGMLMEQDKEKGGSGVAFTFLPQRNIIKEECADTEG